MSRCGKWRGSYRTGSCILDWQKQRDVLSSLHGRSMEDDTKNRGRTSN